MAERDIIQNSIHQLGQSQEERKAPELDIHYVDVDERTSADLLRAAGAFATQVNFYGDDPLTPAGDWSTFFPTDEALIQEALSRTDGRLTPHLALFAAFLELYRKPQAIANRLTGQHLDFFYRDVLRQQRKAAVADRVHLLLELKKKAVAIAIGPDQLFTAGKDAAGVELLYGPTATTVVSTARVAELRSIFVDRSNHGVVRSAPIANSSDGLGGELAGDALSWRAFGYDALPAAEVGFAVASPVLRMAEGRRVVTLRLTLGDVDNAKLTTATLADAFEVFVTGTSKWIGPYTVSPTLSSNEFTLTFTVPKDEEAVADYSIKVHQAAYTTDLPVMQVFLRSGATGVGISSFQGVSVRKARVEVAVSGITTLTLASDSGTLDPKKAFYPFGAQPAKGAQFLVGCGEALAKKLSEMTVTVQWKDAPVNFATLYNGYGKSGVNNDYFTASVVFQDAGSWACSQYGVKLFAHANAGNEQTFTFATGPSSGAAAPSTGKKIRALATAGSRWAERAARSRVLAHPVFTSYQMSAANPKTGCITFSLEKDFLHATFRCKYVENVMRYSLGEVDASGNPIPLTILQEPYTPAIRAISLGYRAISDPVDLAAKTLDAFAADDVQFFHVAPFGRMREHAYQRDQFAFVTEKTVPLLPPFAASGEFLLGFSGLSAGDSVSVLFQVAEGSANPERNREQPVWSVLCDNYWKPLAETGVVADSTNGLLTSGIITFVLPKEASTSNSLLPADRLWVKAALAGPVDAVAHLVSVAANAVEARFLDQGNDPAHLATSLPAGKIVKLKTGLAAVQSVKQPYASFGGRMAETESAFNTRVAERLRHKNRCITRWDYERIVLEAFPAVHKVKCIPHAGNGSWLAPGHVLLVVVPDLKNKNAMDPLAPKVDADTLDRIADLVQSKAGMGVRVAVKNPAYQPIRLDFVVRFKTGYGFNYHRGELERELIRFLSPWAWEPERDMAFGGGVYKSVLLDFVEDLNYVDYLTDFKMYSGASPQDVDEIRPETPDAILVSAASHRIVEA